MNKTTEALKLAEEALNAMLTHMGMDEDEWTKPTFNQAREALAAIREALEEQEKQEPVYAFRRRGLDDFCTCTKERYEELVDKPNLFEVTTFYAASVSAEPCKECGAKQAQIDRLMLEYCPDEMTHEQMQEWEKNIKPFVEPENQEPVAWMEDSIELYVSERPSNTYTIPLYAAPVSAEAIRAEALEEAAKVCRTAQAQGLQSIREAIEEAIRGLK